MSDYCEAPATGTAHHDERAYPAGGAYGGTRA